MKRTLTVLSTLAGLLTLLLSFGAIPASANASQGYVAGGGIVTNDWGDEGTMSQTRNADTGATELWQWVLYADGAIKPNGHLFSLADIDGEFGPITAAATRNWQSRHGVWVDGVVGPQTFSAADGNLKLIGDFGELSIRVDYVGWADTISFLRDKSDGAYYSFVPFHPAGTPEVVRANYIPLCILNGTCF